LDAIVVLLGLVIGIVIFMLFMSNVKAIFYNLKSVLFTFIICWGIGIVLAWIAWKLAIIVGIIALIAYIVLKMFGSSDEKDEEESSEAGGEEKTEA
jgi:hypothetical protein